MVLTGADDSDDADMALVVPTRETGATALGTGEGGIALPKAFPNADIIAPQAKDPDCLRYMQVVNKPRAQWLPHLASAPLQFLYATGVLCVQISCYPQTSGSEPYACSASAITEDISDWPRHSHV